MECYNNDPGTGWAYESRPVQWGESGRLLRPEWGTAYQQRMFQYCPQHRLKLLTEDLRANLRQSARLIMWAFDWPTILSEYMFRDSELGQLDVMANGQLPVHVAVSCASHYSEPAMNDLCVDLLVMARDMGSTMENATRIHPSAAVGDCLLELMRVDLLANPRTEARCPRHEKQVEAWLNRRLGPLNASDVA